MSSQVQNKPLDLNRGPGIIFANFVFGGTAFVVVAFHLYTRFRIKAVAGWDDVLILIATICALAYSSVETVHIVGGHYGHHHIYISFSQMIVVKKTNVSENILFTFALLFSRASICVLLLRIFSSVRKWAGLIYVALALNIMASIISVVTYAIYCLPVKKGWDSSVHGLCLPKDTINKLNQTVAAVYRGRPAVGNFNPPGTI